MGTPTYKVDAPNLVADKDGIVIGIVTGWNPHGVGECIVQYFDGSASSIVARDLIFPNGWHNAYQWMNNREP